MCLASVCVPRHHILLSASTELDLYLKPSGEGRVSFSGHSKMSLFPKHPLRVFVQVSICVSQTAYKRDQFGSIINLFHCLHAMKELQVDAFNLVEGIKTT